MRKPTNWRWIVLGAVVAVLIFSQGCAALKPVGTYFVHRYQDLGEIADFGLSVTKTPQVGLYWNSLEIIVFGHCDLDGWFVGWGGGQIGVTRMYAKCSGFLIGEEIIGWGPKLGEPGTVDESRDDILIKRRSGMLGIMSNLAGAEFGNNYGSGPNYTPACVHFVPHLGWLGIVWNVRYTEIVDFMLGWVGLDISGDDGYEVGEWSFPRRRGPGPEEDAPVAPAVSDSLGTSPGK